MRDLRIGNRNFTEPFKKVMVFSLSFILGSIIILGIIGWDIQSAIEYFIVFGPLFIGLLGIIYGLSNVIITGIAFYSDHIILNWPFRKKRIPKKEVKTIVINENDWTVVLDRKTIVLKSFQNSFLPPKKYETLNSFLKDADKKIPIRNLPNYSRES